MGHVEQDPADGTEYGADRSDGQHDPREAAGLIDAWRDGADLVIGSRTRCTLQQPTHRRYFNRLSSLLVTLAAVDRLGWLPDGWLLVGSFVGLIYALVVRFLAVAHQGIESSVGKVSPSVVASARTLGAGRFRVATRVELPLAGAGIIAASVLVAIDTLKELPITLILRPFGTETLPIWVWQATSESLWVQAAVPSLAIVAVGMVLVAALLWALEHGAETVS